MAKKKPIKVRSIFNPKVDGKYHPPGEEWKCPDKHLTRLIEDGSVVIVTALEDLADMDPADMTIAQLRDVLEDMKAPLSRHMKKHELEELLIKARNPDPEKPKHPAEDKDPAKKTEAEKDPDKEQNPKPPEETETKKDLDSEASKETETKQDQDPKEAKDPEDKKEQPKGK